MQGEDQTENEPRTPLWLPVLGAVLFLAWAIWWGTRAVPQPAPEPPAPAASASAASSAQPAH